MIGKSVVQEAGQVATTLATSRVIGYTKSISYKKGKKNPKVIQENLNIGIQAWEVGFLIAAAGAYEFLTGDKITTDLAKAGTAVSGGTTTIANMVNPGNPANGLGDIVTFPLYGGHF